MTERHTNPCKKLFIAEWLGYKIVSPTIQESHFVVVRITNGKHDYGPLKPFPQILKDGQPIHIPQRKVQQNQVGSARGSKLQALFSIRSLNRLITL